MTRSDARSRYDSSASYTKLYVHIILFLARVKLMPGNFIDASTNDEKLRDIKLVLITALCSKSGVANPVSFVVTEGEGICWTTAKSRTLGLAFSVNI